MPPLRVLSAEKKKKKKEMLNLLQDIKKQLVNQQLQINHLAVKVDTFAVKVDTFAVKVDTFVDKGGNNSNQLLSKTAYVKFPDDFVSTEITYPMTAEGVEACRKFVKQNLPETFSTTTNHTKLDKSYINIKIGSKEGYEVIQGKDTGIITLYLYQKPFKHNRCQV